MNLEFFQALMPFFIVFIIFYVIVFLPQARRQKAHKIALDNMKKDDVVVTIGGMIGSVVSIHDDHVDIKTCDSIVRFKKSSVSDIVSCDKTSSS